MSFDIRDGSTRAQRNSIARIAALAMLPQRGGVVVVLADDIYRRRLAMYSADLSGLEWEHRFDEPVTALVADKKHSLIAVSVGFEGHIVILDGTNGDILAADLSLGHIVNDLAFVQGRLLAAASENYVAIIRYMQ